MSIDIAPQGGNIKILKDSIYKILQLKIQVDSLKSILKNVTSALDVSTINIKELTLSNNELFKANAQL